MQATGRERFEEILAPAFAAEDDAATLVKRADAELPRNARQR